MTPGKLRDEIGKREPFQLLEQEAMLNLMRTTDQVEIEFSRLFREHDLTSAQYNILRILRGEGGPLQSLEIARRTVTVVPGITGLIDRLEKKGLVQRQRDSEDRRVVRVAITDDGLAKLDQLDEPVLQLHGKLWGHLSEEELRQLIQLLEKARLKCKAETA